MRPEAVLILRSRLVARASLNAKPNPAVSATSASSLFPKDVAALEAEAAERSLTATPR
jgi:hypothetical protein